MRSARPPRLDTLTGMRFIAIPAHIRADLNMDRMPWMELFSTPVALLVIGSAAQADVAGAPSIFRARPCALLVPVAIATAGLAHKLIEVPFNERLRHAPPAALAEPEYVPVG